MKVVHYYSNRKSSNTILTKYHCYIQMTNTGSSLLNPVVHREVLENFFKDYYSS